ncbi:MAG: hypothetical protein WD942_02460 [Dehalococcoidia bacterium]
MEVFLRKAEQDAACEASALPMRRLRPKCEMTFGPGVEEPMQVPTISHAMKKNLTPLAAAVLLGLLFVQPADAVDALEPKALKALFPGTFHAVVHGQDVTFDARNDGSLIARSEKNKDTGQWSIRQGELCVMLTSWLDGRTMCARVFPNGDWYRVEHIVFREQ